MPTTDDWTDERLAYYLKQARLEVDLLHGEEGTTPVRPQHLVDVYTEWTKTRADNATLRDRLAACTEALDAATEEIVAGREHLDIAGQEIEALEQREQQARAIIEPIVAGPIYDYLDNMRLRDEARAWLAEETQHAER